jgi:hypothetical protein
MEKTMLLVNSANGVYIPQIFANRFIMERWNVGSKDVIDLNIDSPTYWDTWDRVLNNAFFIANEDDTALPGKWTLYHNGDLWAVHESMTDEEWEEFGAN